MSYKYSRSVNQKPKKWNKKPKHKDNIYYFVRENGVWVKNPDWVYTYDFNTKNRDRAGGHETNSALYDSYGGWKEYYTGSKSRSYHKSKYNRVVRKHHKTDMRNQVNDYHNQMNYEDG